MIRRMLIAVFVIMTSLSVSFADETKHILVSANPDYPPLSWRTKHSMEGAGIELFKMAALQSGLTAEARYAGPWARVQHEAKAGRIDAIAGLYKTPEREGYLIFLEPPFLMDPVVVFTAKGKAFPFRKLADLIGKQGCTVFGNSQGVEFDSFAHKHLNLRLPRTVKEGFELLLSGRADYMVHGLYPGLAVAEMEKIRNKIEYLPHFLASEGLYIGIARNSSFIEYVPQLEKAFKKLRDTGMAEKSMEKYLIRWGKTGPRGGVKLEP